MAQLVGSLDVPFQSASAFDTLDALRIAHSVAQTRRDGDLSTVRGDLLRDANPLFKKLDPRYRNHILVRLQLYMQNACHFVISKGTIETACKRGQLDKVLPTQAAAFTACLAYLISHAIPGAKLI